MNVLLDENVDRRVRRFFDAEHEVMTLAEQGWSGITNGELLSRAEQQFDMLVTMDQNLQYQQSVKERDLAVIWCRRAPTDPRMWSQPWGGSTRRSSARTRVQSLR